MRIHLSLVSLIYILLLSLIGTSIEVHATQCTNPAIRKEWRSLSRAERANWIRAVKCLANLPHSDALTPTVKPDDIAPVNVSSSYYDDIVYMHMDLNHRIHFTGLFLPWHRYYVHVLETALKSKCGFTGTSPYWDWTKDAPDVYGSTMFQESDPISGLGGWGDPNAGYRLSDGAFSSSSSFKPSYPSPHTIARNFTLQPFLGFPLPGFIDNLAIEANTSFTASQVWKLVNTFAGDYKGFQQYFEAFAGAHGSVHGIVGGDLIGTCPVDAPPGCIGGPTFSANEPLFFLHHAMVDKVWADWQAKREVNARAYVGGSTQQLDNFTIYETYPNGGPPFYDLESIMPADGMFPEATIGDVLSTTGDLLCYVYA